MKKRIVSAVVAIAILCVCGFIVGFSYESYKVDKQERAYLLDFIHYCQGNEGLRQIDPSKDYTKSSTHDLKLLAKFYLNQDNFADVTDYWSVPTIESITTNNK